MKESEPTRLAAPTSLAGCTKDFMRQCVVAAAGKLARGTYTSTNRNCGCLDTIVCQAITGLSIAEIEKGLADTRGGYWATFAGLSGLPWEAFEAMDLGFEGKYNPHPKDKELSRIHADARSLRNELGCPLWLDLPFAS